MYALLLICSALLAFELASPWACQVAGIVCAATILAYVMERTGILEHGGNRRTPEEVE